MTAEADKVDIGVAFSTLQPLCVTLVTNIGKSPGAARDTAIADALLLLRDVIPSLPPAGIARCADYVLFPLLAIARAQRANAHDTQKQYFGERNKEMALECIQRVLAKSTVTSTEQFLELLQVFTNVLQPETQSSTDFSSEESRLAALQCLTTLFHMKWPDSLVPPTGTPSLFPVFAFLVSSLLDMAAQQKVTREVRIAALKTLDTFIAFSRESSKSDTNGTKSNILKQVLPGTSSSLGKIILGDWKSGTRIKTLSLEIWAKLVTNVMQDANFPLADFSSPPAPSSAPPTRVANDGNLEVFRTYLAGHGVQINKGSSGAGSDSKAPQSEEETHWLRNAAAQLHRLISLIFPSSFASSTQGFTGLTYIPPKTPFRKQLVISSHNLLTLCARTLASCAPVLLETLILHSDDDDVETAQQASIALSDIFASDHTVFGNADSGKAEFWEALLADNLHRIMKTLPRVITVASGDAGKIVPLKLVAGYMRLLGPSVARVVQGTLEQFSVPLLQVLELDIFDVKIASRSAISTNVLLIASSESQTTSPNSANAISGYPKKTFAHFRDEKIAEILAQVCRLLGFFGDTLLLCDHLVSSFLNENNILRKQAIYVINELILGTAGLGITNGAHGLVAPVPNSDNERKGRMTENVRNMILDEYLSSHLWELPTSNEQIQVGKVMENAPLEDKLGLLSSEKLNDNILTVSLLAEGVGNMAEEMIRSSVTDEVQIDKFLIRVLYPLLEKLGENNSSISQSALTSLQKIAVLYGKSNISELLETNVDFIVDAISYRMKYLNLYPNTPKVFLGLVKYTGAAFLPLLDDTVDLMLQSIDRFTSPLPVYVIMRILHSIVGVLYNVAVEERAERERKAKETRTNEEGKEGEAGEGGERKVKEEEIKGIEAVRRYFTEHHKKKETGKKEAAQERTTERSSSGNVTIEDFNEEEEEGEGKEQGKEEEEEDEPKSEESEKREDKIKTKITRRQREFVKQILEKSRNFVGYSIRELKMLILDIFAKGLTALSASGELYQDSEDLEAVAVLPVVHTLWPHLVVRITDKDNFVVIKVLDVVSEISLFAGDFLRTKFLHELWPSLQKTILREKQVLPAHAQPSAHSHTHDRFSAGFRVQARMLEVTSQLCGSLSVPREPLLDIARTFVHFLSVRQPPELQKLGLQLYETLAKSSKDTSWLIYAELSQKKYEPPDPRVTPLPGGCVPWGSVIMQGVTRSTEYVENAEYLLKRLEN
eukprot:Phypoly_transcript_01027.p1 GENE.Phypoly_transcript_01027~~Phypoly_transcript_01027.p1  ORF type:complete len:1229 (-),score=281.34 Phypoly_transcript_01027:30-3716(-)